MFHFIDGVSRRRFSAVCALLAIALCAPVSAQEDVAAELSNGFDFTSPGGLNQNFKSDSGSDNAPAIATDDTGNWISVWESRHNVGGKIGTDWDILFAVSTNNGKSWSNPKWLNTNAKTDTGSDRRPDVIYVPAADAWVVAWQTNDSLSNTIGTDTDIVYSSSMDTGSNWTAPTHIDANATTDTRSDVNVDLESEGDTNFLAVWQSNDSRSGTIGTDWDIIGASDRDGGTIIPTGVWSDVAPANHNADSDNLQDKYPNAAAGPTGHWHVVWERQVGSGNRDIWSSKNTSDGNTGNWQTEQALSSSPNDERYPTVAVDPNNPDKVVVVWETVRGNDRDITVARSTNATMTPVPWGDRKNLNSNATTDSRDDRRPQIQTDGLGRWLCVWQSKEDLNGTAGRDWDVLWARSTNNGKSWSSPRVVNRDANTDTGADTLPRMANGLTAPGFASKTDYSTGDAPFNVVLIDLNGNNRLDAVTANFFAGTMSVLMGNGDGTFNAKTDYAAGSGAIDVAFFDLNKDGDLDAVTSNFNADTISVFLGNGDGTFNAKTDFSTGNAPYSIALGRLDANNRRDAVTANFNAGTISVLLGNNDGTFNAKTDYTVGTFPVVVVLSDVDKDGNLDAVTGNSSSDTISVLLGNGDGTFNAKTDYAAGNGPVGIAVADVNADGNRDILSSNINADTVSVLLGNGNGTFDAKQDFPVGGFPWRIATADLNGDGHVDVVAANAVGDTISVLFGDGAGNFLDGHQFESGAGPRGIALADVDGDGNHDVITANRNADSISYLTGSQWLRKWLVVWQSNEDRNGADRDNDVFVVRTTNDLSSVL